MNVYKLLQYEMKNGIKNGLYHLTQIKFAYNSNHIEGSKITENQTREIFDKGNFIAEENSITKLNDIFETINHFEAFKFILNNAHKKLDEKMIKQIHLILKDRCSDSTIGEYKKRPNIIGDFTLTTKPQMVQKEIKNLLVEYEKHKLITLDEIINFHYKFEKIHPFEDGNGRVGRLIMFKECLKNDILPFIIEDESRQFYYRGLKQYQTQKGFLLDTCLLSQDNYKNIVEYFCEDESFKNSQIK